MQAIFCPAIWWFYPETSNLSLEDIDLLFLPRDMGGLDGNARVRMTPTLAAEHRGELRRKSDVGASEQVEKAI
jgi:hypothetical protein